jgi:hypothetical protein
MVDDNFLTRLKEIYIKQDGNDASIWEAENPLLERAIREIDRQLDTYEFVQPIARGGAGVVIQLLEGSKLPAIFPPGSLHLFFRSRKAVRLYDSLHILGHLCVVTPVNQ